MEIVGYIVLVGKSCSPWTTQSQPDGGYVRMFDTAEQAEEAAEVLTRLHVVVPVAR